MSKQHAATLNPRFPIIASSADRELNSYIFSRLGPDRSATPQVKAAWRSHVLPVFMAMAESQLQDEIRLVLERFIPDLDVSRCQLKPTTLIVPKERDPKTDKPVGRLIPDPEKLPKQSTISPRLIQMLAALIVSTGRVDYAVNTVIEVRVPCRQLGELIGKSHQYVCQLVQTHGERTQLVRRRQPTSCNSGKGRSGINLKTGGRRGAAAHPATLYQFTVHEQALEMAKAWIAENNGYPLVTFSPIIISEPVEATQEERQDGKAEWVRLLTALAANPMIHPARIRLLLNPLEPVFLRDEPDEQGRLQPTLTLMGRWHYRAEDLIRRVWPHQLRILVPPPDSCS